MIAAYATVDKHTVKLIPHAFALVFLVCRNAEIIHFTPKLFNCSVWVLLQPHAHCLKMWTNQNHHTKQARIMHKCVL